MKTNTKVTAPRTNEGGPAIQSTSHQELRRAVMACMLWESGFYESGESIADRIKNLVPKCDPQFVADLAIAAREESKLRHVPLLLCRELARNSKRFSVSTTLARVIQRADELSEFLAMYWADGKIPIAKQVKRGLAAAFTKFDEYALAKYNQSAAKVKLRDVLFMCHARPLNTEQEELWKRVASDTLATPDTWEVALSGGADKKETFTRLLTEKKLGYLALLRNLRNMTDAGVDRDLISSALLSGAKGSKALPFRFVAAARACPQLEPVLDQAMQLSVADTEKMDGLTVVLVDISGSMDAQLSSKADLSRCDAACALAVLARAAFKDVRVFSFSTSVVEVPARAGMALIDAISKSQGHGGTRLGQAVADIHRKCPNAARLIVITDEESEDAVGGPIGKGYMINVATTKNGVGYGQWTRITGWSESVIRYITEEQA